MRRSLLACAVAAGALVLPSSAFAGSLTLHPDGFGVKSLAAWKAKEGETDSTGGARQALYFQKFVPTATFAAGVAVVNGIAGTPASDLTGLSWEHRDDGHCGAGAPRWNVTVENGGMQRTVFLGCFAAAHSPGSEPGWTKDTNAGPTLAANFLPGDVITGLSIVFDEGTDQGQGFVFLDNITVELNGVPKVWTSAADNGNS